MVAVEDVHIFFIVVAVAASVSMLLALFIYHYLLYSILSPLHHTLPLLLSYRIIHVTHSDTCHLIHLFYLAPDSVPYSFAINDDVLLCVSAYRVSSC